MVNTAEMIQQNVDLTAYNTFGLTVRASKFATFSSVEELDDILKSNKTEELLILGGGSNLLLTKDVDCLVLKNEIHGISIISETDDAIFVKAMAGEVWHNLVMYCIENNLSGIENMSLIPGSVGAAPMQNIGAYGCEIKDVFVELEAYEISSGEIHQFDNKGCQFGYRESIFKGKLKGQYVITSMTLKLSKQLKLNTSYGAIESRLAELSIKKPTIKDVSNAVIHIRQSKLPDPKKIGNSGSFFKNPVISSQQFESLKSKFPSIANYPLEENKVKLAAGWLIDQAGWKGKTMGNYGVHKNQALVLVNYGGASGEDIYKLSEQIIASVQKKYGIKLEREVNVI